MKDSARQNKRATSLARWSPSFRFFEDLVGFQTTTSYFRNRSCPAGYARVSLHVSGATPRCESLPGSNSRFSLPSLLKVVGYSLLQEDCSSVEVIVVDCRPGATALVTFSIVEMMYLLWKCP